MMKILKIGLLLLISNFSYGQINIYDSISVNGQWRTFMTHLPKAYVSSKSYPLILAFHGRIATGYQSIQFQSRLSEKADSAGFVVVYPEGVRASDVRSWNAGTCCSPATDLNIDDVGFVNSLLTTLIKNRHIDSTRVYATGFSNGASFCYKIANELTNRFAAIAIVEGDFLSYPWHPSRAIPIISFHSYQDQIINYFGGITIGAAVNYFPPQDSLMSIISSSYSCLLRKDTLFHDVNKYDHFIYSNCLGNTVIEQYICYDGEHSWPGGLAVSGVKVSNQFSASYLMWQFFQHYTTSHSITEIVPASSNSNFEIFPNPFSSRLKTKNLGEVENFTLFDTLGQLVWSGKQIDNQDFSFLVNGLYFLRMDNKIIKILKK